MKRGGASLIALACLLASAAGLAAEPAAPAKRPLQQDFDAASTAAREGRCAEAIALFAALEKDSRVKPGSFPASAIALRKGVCEVELDSGDGAEASITAALPAIEAAGPDFANDAYRGHRALGTLAARRYDFAVARQHYEAALKPLQGQGRLPLLMALTLVTSYDGTDAPMKYAQEALDIIAAQPEPSKATRANFLTARARAMLNQGQVAPAYKDLKEALKLAGGLTLDVTLDQARMRYDLAQAAMLAGDEDGAHRYLAYTGAGRVKESPFNSAAMMDLPVCGTETGLRPEDQAVVEFSIDPDGSVSGAQTIYTQGGPQVAAAFAQAVREWYWDPEGLAKIPKFYLAASRIELRCTNKGSEAPGILGPLRTRLADWAAKQMPQTAAPAFVTKERVGQVDQSQMDRALIIARQANAPADIINALLVVQALKGPPEGAGAMSKQEARAFAQSLIDMAGKEPFASDPLAAGTLRISGARYLQRVKDTAPVIAALKPVADDARLPEHDPLRQVALLQLADITARTGDFDAARAYFERSGLTEEQCAMLGVSPALRDANASGNDFPQQALLMGFEGWVKVEFDIQADGSTINGRTVTAYPPFAFSEGATDMSRDFKYRSSYRPSGNMACAAHSEGVRFEQ